MQLFYVNKNSEIELGTSMFVINYKPLNKAFKMDQVSDSKQKRFVTKITLYIYIFKV
jgi:hypothetical protein